MNEKQEELELKRGREGKWEGGKKKIRKKSDSDGEKSEN